MALTSRTQLPAGKKFKVSFGDGARNYSMVVYAHAMNAAENSVRASLRGTGMKITSTVECN